MIAVLARRERLFNEKSYIAGMGYVGLLLVMLLASNEVHALAAAPKKGPAAKSGQRFYC